MSLLLTLNIFTPCSSVSIVNFEQVNAGWARLILHLRYVDTFVYKERIKCEDWRTLRDFVDNKGFLYKFDINQSYHHIDIDENRQNFLGFSWNIDGKIWSFMFTVLPVGLCSAPFIFTKVMRGLVNFWKRDKILKNR